MTARADQETTIAAGRLDEVVRIYTSDFRHLQKLRKLAASHDYVREIAGGDDHGQFEVDAPYFHLFSAIRAKRTVSEAERAVMSERLAAARVLRRSASVDEQFREQEA